MMTALVADADRETREVCCWLLTSWGYRVETAGNSLECLNRLSRFVPDVLVLGSQLPWGGCDGVLAVLHRETRLLPARVVVATPGVSLSELHDLALAPALRTLGRLRQIPISSERPRAFPGTERVLSVVGSV